LVCREERTNGQGHHEGSKKGGNAEREREVGRAGNGFDGIDEDEQEIADEPANGTRSRTRKRTGSQSRTQIHERGGGIDGQMVRSSTAEVTYRVSKSQRHLLAGGAVRGENEVFVAHAKRQRRVVDREGGDGADEPAGKSAVERMQAELLGEQQRRMGNSRRRAFDGAHGAINERNRRFNQKVQRAFGENAQKIKLSLERGTALPKLG